jgi:hypothetical protein
MPAKGERSTLKGPAVVAVGVLGFLVLIVALAALFDLGPFDDEEAESLSKSEFIAKADEVCQQAHDQFAELQKQAPNSAEGAATLTQNLVDISQNELNQLRALNAPPEVQEGLDRYLRAREQGIAVLERGVQAAKDRNAPAYTKAQAEIAAGQVRRLKLAQAVGFSECSVVRGGTAAG